MMIDQAIQDLGAGMEASVVCFWLLPF